MPRKCIKLFALATLSSGALQSAGIARFAAVISQPTCQPCSVLGACAKTITSPTLMHTINGGQPGTLCQQVCRALPVEGKMSGLSSVRERPIESNILRLRLRVAGKSRKEISRVYSDSHRSRLPHIASRDAATTLTRRNAPADHCAAFVSRVPLCNIGCG